MSCKSTEFNPTMANYSSPRNLSELGFIIPALMDANFKKAQIFCNSRFLSDLVGKFREAITSLVATLCYVSPTHAHRAVRL